MEAGGPGPWWGDCARDSFLFTQHLEEFSVSGRLMGILGIFCVNANHDVSTGASEGLHYLFKLLVLHRSKR